MSSDNPDPDLTEALRAKLGALPDAPGVYLHKNRQGKVIYVGKAVRLAQRVRSYFQAAENRDPRIAHLIERIADFDYIVTATETDALVLEDQLIKEYRPYYNIRLRDDKAYPYLKVTLQEPFPRFEVTRRILEDGARYFGPYTDSRAMRETFKFAAGAFRIRTCQLDLPDRTVQRPCLDYHLGRCTAPCVAYDAMESYRRRVRQLVLFLEGSDRRLVAALRAEMAALSAERRYEEAATARDRLQSLERTLGRTQVVAGLGGALDACGVVRDGRNGCGVVLRIRGGKVLTTHRFFLEDRLESEVEAFLAQLLREYYGRATEVPPLVLISHPLADQEIWQEWLASRRGRPVALRQPQRGAKRAVAAMAVANATFRLDERLRIEGKGARRGRRIVPAAVQLQEALGLHTVPETIECFDISNFQGREAVGSLVTFRGGVPLKSRYRRFRIRTVTGSDDYAMMREVLERHYRRLTERGERPADLVMVDGGPGQLGVARDVLEQCGFGATETIALAKQQELIFRARGEPPIALPSSSAARQLLQRVRDEAHRFAITYHRILRDRRTEASALDAIPGIGAVKKLALLHHFGSAAAVRAAGAAALGEVRGINRRDIERILAWSAAAQGSSGGNGSGEG